MPRSNGPPMIQGQGGALFWPAAVAPGGVDWGWRPVAGAPAAPGVSELGPVLATATGGWAVLTARGSTVWGAAGRACVPVRAEEPVAAPPLATVPLMGAAPVAAPPVAAPPLATVPVTVAWAMGALGRWCASCAPALATTASASAAAA